MIRKVFDFLDGLRGIVWMILADAWLARQARQPRAFVAGEAIRSSGRAWHRGWVIALGVIVLSALAGALVVPVIQQFSILERSTAMQLSDLLGLLASMTVAGFVTWLTTFGVNAAVAYLLGWFPNLSQSARTTIGAVVIAMLIAGTTALANFIPQVWLDKHLLDAVVALISLVVNWAGWRIGGFTAAVHRLDLAFKVNAAKSAGFRVEMLVGVFGK